MLASFRAGRLAALLLVCAPPLAHAQEIKAGDLIIQHPWSRATPAGAAVAGGYLTVTNRGTEADTLTGASLDGAGHAAIHDMSIENGIMKMRQVEGVTIPPGGSATLSPSGRHIMFTGLAHGLKQGQDLPGTLVFAHAGTVRVRFSVEGMGAKVPGHHDDHAMPGMTMD